MKDIFEVAFGSITGNDHRWSGRNNQDACHCLIHDQAIIATVCDGCSESKHSEVGAKIGARLITEGIQKYIEEHEDLLRAVRERKSCTWSKALKTIWGFVLEQARQYAIAHLQILAAAMGEDPVQTVSGYFLFTAVGAIITGGETVVFSIGDGVFIVNGEISQIGPFPKNEPPYLAYGGLVNSSLGKEHPELLKFQLHKVMPTEEVETVLIGTDGVAELIEVAKQQMPGKEETVGPISQFWLDDRYFLNRDMIRRKLFLVNREMTKPIWDEKRLSREKALLPDDTTLVVIRKKTQEREEE